MTIETSGKKAIEAARAAEEDLIRDDIHAFLDQNEAKELMRFVTVGSVDDGKSTLIGRLLHDSKGVYDD
jgi:GTPase